MWDVRTSLGRKFFYTFRSSILPRSPLYVLLKYLDSPDPFYRIRFVFATFDGRDQDTKSVSKRYL